MYLPFTRASDTITKWILCFRKETINDVSNISICNNLGVIQLKGICEDLSELSLPLLSNFRINEYNTSADPLNVFKSNTNQCEAITSTDETRIRIDSEKNCQRDKTHRYMTMQIPVTKPVFMKVIGMSTCAETKLSDSEIVDIMEHLLIFLDNQRSVQRLICQYFLNDNGLYDRLGTLCEERTGQIEQKKSCFEVAYCNLVMEMRNEMCVYSEDEHYNVVFMSDIQEKKNRLLVHTNFLNMASCLFPKNVMEMNSGFLFNNREKLYNLYREASLDESLLVIDIDFSDIFHDPVGKSYIESFCSVAGLNIHKVLRCNFLALCCVKKIVLRFEKTHLTFDLAFLSTVEVDMHLKKCVLRNCVLFPKYLKKLKISNSFIRCSIVLPENLEEISLKDTEIIKDSTVRVDEGCRAICIDQCSGNIYIPYIEKNFHVTFGGTWSVKLVRNSDCFIDVLKMANGTFTDSLEKMNQNIKMLILEEVELLAELVLVLGKFLENITLTKCTGIIRLYTPISEQSIHIRINYGQLVFVRSKKNDSWEFILQSALLMSTVKFNDRLSKLHICGVDFKLDSHIEVHKNTRNVILDNSYRSVFLDDVTGRKKIIPIEQKDFCLEMSDESSPFNSSDVTRSYESQRLLLKYAHVNNSEFLKSNIKRLEFRNVIVEENCVLQIDDGFEELKLYGCIGKFKIPFVSYESESMIDFHETGCSLEIVKTSISTYNLAIKNMNTSRSISVDACISDLNLQHVVMNEDSVFSLKHTCTNICLSYFKGRIIAPHITALDRLVLSNMNLTTNQFLLSIPTNFLEAKSVVLDHSIVVLGAFAQTMYLRWAKLSTETAIQIISTNNLNNFAFSSIATRIDITSIIRSMENSEPSFLVDGDIKYFSEEGMNGCTTFELRNFQVRAHSELAKNVQFVDLEYVFSDNNSILRLNKEVEYIRITFCQANIDVAMVKELKSAVINCSSFVYDQKIYQSLIYLCISDLTIEQNVYLGENLKTLKLEEVTISRNCTFAISKNISRLHIERSCGMMCMLGVGGFTSLALDCGNTLEYVSVPTTRGSYSLRLSNFCFESDIRLSDDIEEVIIEYAKVTNNVKLLLGRECKSVELNTNCINLDNTRASNLQKITLIAISSHVLSQIFSINSLNCLTLEKLNLNSVTKCANHIRTVILRMIDVPEDRIFYVGENCEEFQLLQCNGTFDLSAVKVLRRLVVIPRLNGTMCLKPLHSSLRTVRSLEIAYNFKSSFLQQVLAWCVNVERLTLHGLYYDEAIRSHAFSYISFEKIFGVFVTDIWLKKKHAGLPKHCPTKYDKMMIINLKMNVVFNDMLTFKTWSRLKYLNLVGFSPDSRNTKLLRLFRNLKTLIVDYHFIDEYFFSFLPHELETLKIAERNVLVDSTYDTDTPKCNLDLEGLKDNRNLKTLNLNKEISRISAVFNFLPESLETLQVTWFFLNDACRVKILTKKIALKQLVLCVNTEEKSSFIDRNPFTRQYRSLFDYFRNFIDFEGLIELTLEVNGEQINLDTKTYRIK